MWLFIWKKYEDSWIATAVSFVGNIAAALGAILCGFGIGALASKALGGTVGSILAIVAGLESMSRSGSPSTA